MQVPVQVEAYSTGTPVIVSYTKRHRIGETRLSSSSTPLDMCHANYRPVLYLCLHALNRWIHRNDHGI